MYTIHDSRTTINRGRPERRGKPRVVQPQMPQPFDGQLAHVLLSRHNLTNSPELDPSFTASASGLPLWLGPSLPPCTPDHRILHSYGILHGPSRAKDCK